MAEPEILCLFICYVAATSRTVMGNHVGHKKAKLCRTLTARQGILDLTQLELVSKHRGPGYLYIFLGLFRKSKDKIETYKTKPDSLQVLSQKW